MSKSVKLVDPLLFANLAWRTLSWCRRTSVRPQDDMEKSVAHRLPCAMPLSGNFAIQATSLFQSSLNLHFIFGASRFFAGGSAIAYPENVENSAQNYSENAGDYPIGIHHHRHAVRPRIHRSPTENSAPDFSTWGACVRIVVEP